MNDDDDGPDRIGAGYCFSAAPPPPPPASRSVAGRGGRMPKAGRKQPKSGIGVGVHSFFGSGGVGLLDGGFRTVGGSAAVAGSCLPVTRNYIASEHAFCNPTLKDNVGGFEVKQVGNRKTEKESFVFGFASKSNSTVGTVLENTEEMPTLRESIPEPDSTARTTSLSSLDVHGLSASVNPSSSFETDKPGVTVETSSVQPASSPLDEQRNCGFHFSSTADGIEFKSASVKSSIFSTVDQKVEFTAKINVAKTTISRKKKDKTKISPVQVRHAHFGKDYLLKDIGQSTPCFSPNLSTFPELVSGNRISRESSLTSHESFDLGTHSEQSDSRLSDSNDAVEDDLAALTQHLNLNEHGFKSRDLNATSDRLDAVDRNSRSSVENATSSNTGGLITDRMPNILFGSTGEAASHSKFIFGAPVPAQKFAPAQVSNNKNQTKGVCKNDGSSVSAAALFAQELCEKWRLRGNQAYAGGDFSRAEEYYTNGILSIPPAEKSKICHKVLLLCYSNRAASRMALGRMREALEDCICASVIDRSFLKAQLRAANCYLALGELEDASNCFKKLLQMGADVIDRKTLVEATDGLQNAQKVSECLIQYTTLPSQGAISDAEKCIVAIDEALSISPYREKLLQIKAETLCKLRKFEEVIQLCEHSLGSAEMNHSTSTVDEKLTYEDDFVISKYNYFRHWRYHLIVKSCFQLGRLEQAVDLLEKEASRKGIKILESSIPLACTVRELVRHKVAGNEAFQLGKYEEAVEHYSAALAKNVGSRPFAAICYCNRAAAYKALNQIADAISDCCLATALDQNYTKAISRRASLYEVIRDYDQAAKDLRRLVFVLKANIEENKHASGTSDKSTNLSLTNDLREAEVRLSEMEEAARKDIPINLYLILGVESLASPTEIRKAYRKSALKHHPDKAGQILGNFDVEDDDLWKEIVDEVHRDTDRIFKMIGEAYTVLSDATKRSHYDLKEETRSSKLKVNKPATQSEFQSHAFDRSSSGRQWTDMWTSYRQSQGQSQEANRSKWYSG